MLVARFKTACAFEEQFKAWGTNVIGSCKDLPDEKQSNRTISRQIENLKEEYYEIKYEGPGGRQVSRSKG